MMSNDPVLLPIATDKLYFYSVPNNEDRLLIHSYMEKYHTNIFKTSLKCEYLGLKENACYKCNCGDIIKMNYHYGYMENNYDEYYTGTCINCGEDMTYECNMEGPTSKFFHIEENNIILFGNRDIFKSYHNRTSKYKQNIPDKFQFEQILKQNTLYSIEMPTN